MAMSLKIADERARKVETLLARLFLGWVRHRNHRDLLFLLTRERIEQGETHVWQTSTALYLEEVVVRGKTRGRRSIIRTMNILRQGLYNALTCPQPKRVSQCAVASVLAM